MARKAFAFHVMAVLLCMTSVVSGEGPRNVILLIGDGMGAEQVKAAGYYAHGRQGLLSFEQMPFSSTLTTHPAFGTVTDSAAAATAMATGYKVENEVISVARPANEQYGPDEEMETLLEFYRDRGRATGLVTTTYMTHATPAAFGAHQVFRSSTSSIAGDYLNQTRPNVLLGGGEHGMSLGDAQSAGYATATDEASLLTAAAGRPSYLSGQFGGDHMPYELDGLGALPRLPEMTEIALDLLDDDPEGMFLMVEGGRIDHAAHNHQLERMIGEVLAFSETVQLVLDWAAGRDDTLVLVTADHETGGLTVTETDPIAGVYPSVTWSTGGHTSAEVGLWGWGVGADQVLSATDNTDVHSIAIPEPASVSLLLAGAGWVIARKRRRNGR